MWFFVGVFLVAFVVILFLVLWRGFGLLVASIFDGKMLDLRCGGVYWFVLLLFVFGFFCVLFFVCVLVFWLVLFIWCWLCLGGCQIKNYAVEKSSSCVGVFCFVCFSGISGVLIRLLV